MVQLSHYRFSPFIRLECKTLLKEISVKSLKSTCVDKLSAVENTVVLGVIFIEIKLRDLEKQKNYFTS